MKTSTDINRRLRMVRGAALVELVMMSTLLVLVVLGIALCTDRALTALAEVVRWTT